jgi:hypothetical protein
MKATIRGVEVEGSAKEMKELIELLARPSPAVQTKPNPVLKSVAVSASNEHRIGNGGQKHLLAEMFIKNPRTASLDVISIMDAYKKEYGFKHVKDLKVFAKNVKRAMKLVKNGYARKKKWAVSKSVPKRHSHGQFNTIFQLLHEKPSMLNSTYSDIYAEYCKRRGLPFGNFSGGFSTRVKEAKELVRKELGESSITSAKSEASKPEKEHVRYFHWGISLPYVLKIVQERMPEHFGVKEMMHAILVNLNMPVQPSHSKYISLQSSLPKYLRMLVQKGYLIGEKSNGQWVFTKLKQAVPVQQAVKPAFPMAVEEPYIIPMIPKDTLDTIVNTYMGISPESLIGISAKNGKTLTSNDARYLFKNLMENMGSIQKLYPGKKFTIAGQGQWKSIEIK